MKFAWGAAAAVSTLMVASAATAQQPLTDNEIRALLVGKTAVFNSGVVADYMTDGSYSGMNKAGARSSGRYEIKEQSVCVEFNDGRAKCDRIMKDSSGYYLVTKTNYVDRLNVRSLGAGRSNTRAQEDCVKGGVNNAPGAQVGWIERNCYGTR